MSSYGNSKHRDVDLSSYVTLEEANFFVEVINKTNSERTSPDENTIKLTADALDNVGNELNSNNSLTLEEPDKLEPVPSLEPICTACNSIIHPIQCIQQAVTALKSLVLDDKTVKSEDHSRHSSPKVTPNESSSVISDLTSHTSHASTQVCSTCHTKIHPVSYIPTSITQAVTAITTLITEGTIVSSHANDSDAMSITTGESVSTKYAMQALTSTKQVVTALHLLLHSETTNKHLTTLTEDKLELLVEEIQKVFSKSRRLNGGGFELYISVLQAISECKPNSIVNIIGNQALFCELEKLAVSLIHVYVVSRAVNGSFRNVNDMSKFITHDIGTEVPTTVGLVPDWVLSLEDEKASVTIPMVLLFDQYRKTSGNLTLKDRAELVSHTLTMLSLTSLAKYTHVGTAAPPQCLLQYTELGEQMEAIRSAAIGGSTVALRMQITRRLWYHGIDFLELEQYAEAVECFAASIRSGTCNGDTFDGCLPEHFTKSILCTNSMLAMDYNNDDAILFSSVVWIHTGDVNNAQNQLKRAITINTTDAYGSMYHLALCEISMGLLHEAIELLTHCIELKPYEPIFYYRRATARQRAMGDNADDKTLLQILGDYEHFQVLSAPESCFLSMSWYKVALLRSMLSTAKCSTGCGLSQTGRTQYLQDMNNAKQSEKTRLSVFPAYTEDEVNVMHKAEVNMNQILCEMNEILEFD